jgi:hypothetical protein
MCIVAKLEKEAMHHVCASRNMSAPDYVMVVAGYFRSTSDAMECTVVLKSSGSSPESGQFLSNH